MMTSISLSHASDISVPREFKITNLHVFWSDHHVESDHFLVAEGLIRPATDGPDELDSADSIVGHQDFLNSSLSAKTVYVLPWRSHLYNQQ